MIEMGFTGSHTFDAYWKAEQWCRDNGISYGPMCSHMPTGLMYGNIVIMKYRNLTPKERRTLDGTLTGDFRDGPVILKIRDRRPQ